MFVVLIISCTSPCREPTFIYCLSVPQYHKMTVLVWTGSVAPAGRFSGLLCLCATGSSCKGRCGEPFRRGRRCSCDAECVTFKQCCPDYQAHCGAGQLGSGRVSLHVCMFILHGFTLWGIAVTTVMTFHLFLVIWYMSRYLPQQKSVEQLARIYSCQNVNESKPKSIFDLVIMSFFSSPTFSTI